MYACRLAAFCQIFILVTSVVIPPDSACGDNGDELPFRISPSDNDYTIASHWLARELRRPDAKNAYAQLQNRAALSKLYGAVTQINSGIVADANTIKDSCLMWDQQSFDELFNWLNANSTEFRNYVLLVDRPYYTCFVEPASEVRPPVTLEHHLFFRNFNTLLLASTLEKTCEPQVILTRLEFLLNFSQKMQDNPIALDQQLASKALDSIFTVACALSENNKIPQKQMLSFLRRMQIVDASRESRRTATIKVSFMYYLASLQDLVDNRSTMSKYAISAIEYENRRQNRWYNNSWVRPLDGREIKELNVMSPRAAVDALGECYLKVKTLSPLPLTREVEAQLNDAVRTACKKAPILKLVVANPVADAVANATSTAMARGRKGWYDVLKKHDSVGRAEPFPYDSVKDIKVIDPFSGTAMRIKQSEDTIFLYSVGKDHVDDGGDALKDIIVLSIKGRRGRVGIESP